MPMTLDSRDLRAVLETARTGSVTRAADRLHVTQSAVSHQLRALEGRLGTPLFLRTGRRMLPTPAGLELVRAAERVLGELTRAEALVARLVRQQAGELRVATQCHTGYHWLPPLLKSARARFPHHTVRILAEHTAHPIAALLDGRLDLGVANDLPRDSRLRVRPLFEDEHAAIVLAGAPVDAAGLGLPHRARRRAAAAVTRARSTTASSCARCCGRPASRRSRPRSSSSPRPCSRW